MSGKYLLGNMLSAIYNKNCFYDVPVSVEYSGLCIGVLNEMKNFGYIDRFDIVNKDGKQNVDVFLKTINGKKNINSFKLFSKPSCRIYKTVTELKKMAAYNPYALVLISTSKGVLPLADAIEKKVGGEVLCEIF